MTENHSASLISRILSWFKKLFEKLAEWFSALWRNNKGGPTVIDETGMDYRRFDFPEEGVTVIVPVADRALGVRKLPLVFTREMCKADAEAEWTRPVISFDLFDPENPQKPLTEFGALIELWVRYTAEDLRLAKEAGKELGLYFWDGGQWVPFDEKKHGFKLLHAERSHYQGYGVATFDYWGDPMITWRPR